jgi:hypothetical protein
MFNKSDMMLGLALIGAILIVAVAIPMMVEKAEYIDTTNQTGDVPSDGPMFVPKNPDFALGSPYGRLQYVDERCITLCGVTHCGSFYTNGMSDVLIDETGQVVWGENRG